MHYKKIIFNIILLLIAQQSIALPIDNILTGSESSSCQNKKISDHDNLSNFITCLEGEEKKINQKMDNSFNKALQNIQSEAWLLPNIDYEDNYSEIVAENKKNLLNSQKLWLKSSDEYCSIATSGISNSAPMYSVLLIQCRINIKKERIKYLNYLGV